MRDLHAIGAWALGELHLLGHGLRERQLWLALLGGVLLWSLAYQAPLIYRLDIGGSLQTLRQHDDAPFLRGFNAPEPPTLTAATQAAPYRWAEDRAAIVLPGVGLGQWQVVLRAASGRPDGSAVTSRLNSAPVEIAGAPRAYHLQLASDAAGDLRLALDTPPLAAPADPRALGLVLFRADVMPAAGLALPAPATLGWLTAALALLYLLLRRLVFGPRAALLLALGCALAAGLALAYTRLALTLLAPMLGPILLGCYALALLGLVLVGSRQSAVESNTADGRPHIVGLVVLALALRLGGMLHPHAIFSDAGLNTNNLIAFTSGEVLFSEGLPAEAGGGRAPYPPAQYIALAPFQLLLPSDRAVLGLLVKAGNALADSLVVGLVWLLLRGAGASRRAALLGAALYVLPPPLLRSLSVGEFANVFGQAWALAAVALAVYAVGSRQPAGALWAADCRLPTADSNMVLGSRLLVLRAAGAALLLSAALLGHFGVAISLAGLLAGLVLAWLARRATRASALLLALGAALAGLLVGLLYYSAFADLLLARMAAAPQPSAGSSLTERLAGELRLARLVRIELPLLALGLAGTLLLARQAWAGLGALLAAWWGGTLLALGLLVFAGQGVRWQAFLYPALCLGAGPALARLGGYGRAGRVVALALLALLIGGGLEFWVAQIRDYLH